MKKNIDDFYNFLKTDVTAKKLSELTAKIISAYKNKQYDQLKAFAEKNYIEFEKRFLNKLFTNLISIYHPDKLSHIIKDIDSAYVEGNLAKLKYFANVYSDMEEVSITNIDYSEEYGLNDEDYIKFGLHVAEETEIFADIDEITDLYEHNISFSEAVNKEFCRNRGYDWNVVDLNRLEGDIELQYQNIDDLSGIEDCIYISGLNLTHNRLTDISQLQNLHNLENLYLAENQLEDISYLSGAISLKELDLSFNRITELKPLLSLPRLQFVNLVGNPTPDPVIIKELTDRNITVIT